MFYELMPDLGKSEYVWCLHCERVWTAKALRNGECPHCGASPMDIQPWTREDMPRNVHPGYPEVPNVGGLYPLYEPAEGETVGGVRTD